MKKIEEVLNESTPTLLVLEHVSGDVNAVDTKYLLADLKSQFGDGLNILKLDTSYDGKMKARYAVVDYPTYILYKQGQELMRESGKKSLSELVEMVKTA